MGDPSFRLSFPGNISIMHSCYDKTSNQHGPVGLSGTSELEDTSEVRWFLYLMQKTLDRRLKRREEVGRRQVKCVE